MDRVSRVISCVPFDMWAVSFPHGGPDGRKAAPHVSVAGGWAVY